LALLAVYEAAIFVFENNRYDKTEPFS